MSFYVKFWGTRGSIPTPGYRTQRFGGNTPCVEVRTDTTMIVCDAGSGLRELGMDIDKRFGPEPVTLHLLLSHTHWDHIQGFPFFIPAYRPSTTIHVYGASKADRTSHQLLTGQMESAHFPVDFTALGAQILAREFIHGEIQIGDVTARAFTQIHPGGSVGFSLLHGGKKVVYSTDNELDKSVLNADAVARDPAAPRQFPAEIIEPFRDAELLIADAQYTELEYPKRVGWGHPSTAAVVDLALAAGVKQLALFHHDPMQSDSDLEQKVASCAQRAKERGGREATQVFGAREGVELKLV